MTPEEFINEHLCPTGVVTAWDAQVITTALRFGDTKTITAKITELATKAGLQAPALFSDEVNP